MITWIRCPSSGESIIGNVLIANILCATISGGCAPNPVKVATALPKNRCRQGFLAHLCPLWIETRHRSLYAGNRLCEIQPWTHGYRDDGLLLRQFRRRWCPCQYCHQSERPLCAGNKIRAARANILLFSILYIARPQMHVSVTGLLLVKKLSHFLNRSY